MPRLFTNRPRQSLFPARLGAGRLNWERTSAILYIVGGSTFILGSIFFLPQYEALSDLGAWIFFIGSLVYLLVTGYDLLESSAYVRSGKGSRIWSWLELAIAGIYVGGTVLFTVGSLLFLSQIDWIVAGGWCFTIGSLFFLFGAFLNAIQIIKEESIVRLQLLNATAIAFALGSILFLVASLPYLSEALNLEDNRVLFAYVGWEYIAGSILFLLGGITHYYRLHKAKHYHQAERKVHQEVEKHKRHKRREKRRKALERTY